MKYAVLDVQGLPTAFYDSAIHSDGVPQSAVPISDAQWQEFIDNPGTRRLSAGEVVPFTPPPPVPTLDDYLSAIQAVIDAKARERGYDNGMSCATYANSTNPNWSNEAGLFIEWRDTVWIVAQSTFADVQAGTVEAPSVADLVASLPGLEWPA